MKVTETYNIWDDKDKVYGQRLNTELDSLGPMAVAASQLVYSMQKKFEKAMFAKFTLEQLEAVKQLIDEVIAEGNWENSNELKLQFPEFKSFGLTKEQTFEVVENYIEWHCKLGAEQLQEVANDDLTHKNVHPYLEDMALLLKFKEENSCLFYSRFMESD